MNLIRRPSLTAICLTALASCGMQPTQADFPKIPKTLVAPCERPSPLTGETSSLRDLLKNHTEAMEMYTQVCLERDATRNLLKNRGL